MAGQVSRRFPWASRLSLSHAPGELCKGGHSGQRPGSQGPAAPGNFKKREFQQWWWGATCRILTVFLMLVVCTVIALNIFLNQWDIYELAKVVHRNQSIIVTSQIHSCVYYDHTHTHTWVHTHTCIASKHVVHAHMYTHMCTHPHTHTMPHALAVCEFLLLFF